MKIKSGLLRFSMAVFSLLFVSEIAMAAGSSISSEESAKIDDYLKNFSKNVVVIKETKNASGETVSCVDINHQPALNNPLLAGHKVQMEPSPELKRILQRVKQDTISSPCPTGSVEMRLPTRERIQVFGSLKKFLSKYPDSNGNSQPQPVQPPATTGHLYSAVEQDVNSTAAQATFNVWQPSVMASINDFSLSQLWVGGGRLVLRHRKL